MVKIEEYEKSDKSIAIAKRLQVTLVIDNKLTRQQMKGIAIEQIERYKKDTCCRDKIVRQHMFGSVMGYEKTPDVIWLDFIAVNKDSTAKARRARILQKAEPSRFKMNVLWVSPALPTSARPAGLKGEIPAIAGMTHKFNY